MKIQRYTVNGCIDKSGSGNFVKWSDVQKLIALREAEAEAAECEASRKVCPTHDESHVKFGNTGNTQHGSDDIDAMLKARDTTNAARRDAGVEQSRGADA